MQYTTWYDKGKIKADAKKVQHLLDGRQYTYGTKEGKFCCGEWSASLPPSMPKNITTVWTILDILAICWELDLTPNISTAPAPKANAGHG